MPSTLLAPPPLVRPPPPPPPPPPRHIVRHHGARTILDSVDVRVDAGSRLALIGPNGSGKSTLLRILAGLERPDAGTVRTYGTVGYLPQLASESESDATDAGAPATVRGTILE